MYFIQKIAIGSVLFIVSIYSTIVFGQDTISYVKIEDTYVLEIEILNKEMSSKCICAMKDLRNAGKCALFKASVEKALVQRDTSLFSEEQLLEIEYFIISTNEEIELNKKYFAFCRNSSDRKYLVVNKILDEREKMNLKYASYLPYYIGASHCRTLSLWQRLSLFFGRSKEKVYENIENRPKKRNRFLEYIEAKD